MKNQNCTLRQHRLLNLLIYFIAFYLAYKVILQVDMTFISILSAGAIVATFGSALSTIGLVGTSDNDKRVILNVDILFRDLIKCESWRRWPFLPRNGKAKIFDGEYIQGELKNPSLPIDVGTHSIKIEIPTVQDDFFDLNVIENLFQLLYFKKSAYTVACKKENINKKIEDYKEDQAIANYMIYDCLLDIWKSIFIFRLSRYVVHLGVGLTISSAIISFFLISIKL